MKSICSAAFLSALLVSSASYADIKTVIIDPRSLPYDLSPDKYDNSPDKYDNSPSKYDNSESKYDNSPSKYDNSASNHANRIGGGRNIVTEDGKALGYYVFGEGGIINFYNYNSRRVAYLPAGGQTQSVFSEEGWCGTMGEIRGNLALGITQSCFYAFHLLN